MTVSNNLFKKKFDGFYLNSDSSKKNETEVIVEKEEYKPDGKIIKEKIIPTTNKKVNLELSGPQKVSHNSNSDFSNINSRNISNHSTPLAPQASPTSHQPSDYKVSGTFTPSSNYSSGNGPSSSGNYGACCNMARSGGIRRCMTCPNK